MHIECSTNVAAAEAKAPVKNGTTAPPLDLALEMKLIEVVCMSLGSDLAKIVWAQGYTGPNNRPTTETNTTRAVSMNYGNFHQPESTSLT